MMVGNFPMTRSWISSASSSVSAVSDAAILRPILVIASLKSRRSSATSMEARSAPISSMPRSARIPFSARSLARFSAVWPPIVGSTASGASFSRMPFTASVVMGPT